MTIDNLGSRISSHGPAARTLLTTRPPRRFFSPHLHSTFNFARMARAKVPKNVRALSPTKQMTRDNLVTSGSRVSSHGPATRILLMRAAEAAPPGTTKR